MSNETPSTVHGRLLEAVHISGYTLERAWGELEWLLVNDRWKEVGGGYDDINAFLATLDWSKWKLLAEQRKNIAKRLADADASQRATAKMLGVDHRTIGNDLRGESSPSPRQRLLEMQERIVPAGENSPRPWFQKDTDPSLAAKREVKAETRIANVKNDEERILKLAPIAGKFRTIILDPAWDYDWLSLAGRAKPGYAMQTHEDLLALDVKAWADEESGAHLYLWCTNNFMARACELVAKWGFHHRTLITWVKPPPFGLGSYYRNSTEHVLFATLGDTTTRHAAASIPTHFEAPRGEHSEKPERFYDIVRAASYPPYGEGNQRLPRPDFQNLFEQKDAAA